LVRRGYRPGRVDGRFGPRTRAAVLWFQTKHGLPRTGRIDARGVMALRTTPQAGRPARTSRPPSAAEEEARAVADTAVAAPERADRTLLVLLAALLMVGIAAIAGWTRAELRRRPARAAVASGAEPRVALAAVASPPAHPPVAVLGYIAAARGADSDRALEHTSRTIGSWCEDHGWQLTQIVHDVKPARESVSDRPGLAYVLDQIAAGHVAGLVLARLDDLTHSVSELARLLGWLHQANAFVIALDDELDTSTSEGRLAAGELIQIGDFQRNGNGAGLTAIRSQGTAAKRANAGQTPGRWDNHPT
jgi:hypothetical protein